MSKNKKINLILIFLAVVVSCTIITMIIFSGGKEETKKEKIGFITPGSKVETGWNRIHFFAIEKVCNELGVTLEIKENISENSGKCGQAIDELVVSGAEVIFLNSYGYTSEAKETISKYSDIHFYANESGVHDTNLSSYFVRMYQARYLSGIIAGMRTESNQIGYVAAMSNYEVNRGINAFTLGVKSVNPDAEVIVIWTESWDNEAAEREAVGKLAEEGIDVITYHQNQGYVAKEADKRGIDSIGYHQAVEGLSEHFLTAVVCDWEAVYRELIKEYVRGNGNSHESYWLGMEKNAVGLSEYSELVSEDIIKKVEEAKSEIVSGFEVFSGVIYDNEGNLRCGQNEIISDVKLLKQMDWFVEGVNFYED